MDGQSPTLVAGVTSSAQRAPELHKVSAIVQLSILSQVLPNIPEIEPYEANKLPRENDCPK